MCSFCKTIRSFNDSLPFISFFTHVSLSLSLPFSLSLSLSLTPSSPAPHYLDYIGLLPVMIMEFVPGGSLRGYLDKKRANITADLMSRSKTIFVNIGQQIAEGMKYLVSWKLTVHVILLILILSWYVWLEALPQQSPTYVVIILCSDSGA